MTLIIATTQTNTASDGRVYSLGQSLTFFVPEDVMLAASGADGIAVEVSTNARLQIDGTLVADGEGAIRQDDAATQGLLYINVGSTGTLLGDGGIVLSTANNTITNAGEIRGAIGSGIQISQGGNALINTGAIYGASTGVFLGNDDNAVDNSGLIHSATPGQGYGLAIAGTGNEVNNSGEILVTALGSSEAVRFYAGGNTLVNSGSIRSTDLALYVSEGTAGSINVITNTGRIETTGAGDAIRLTGSDDQLVNSGTIIGGIGLGTGNDLFDGAESMANGSIVVGGDGNDTLLGGAGRDVLQGDGGNDSIEGGGGNDLIRPGLGADIIDGGDGLRDLVDYLGSAAVNVNLAIGQLSGGAAQGDLITGVEGLAGGNFNDVLTGDALANTLIGRAGSDLLTGGAGNDQFFGDAGADTLIGGAGVDVLRGGVDADLFRFLTAADSGAPGQARDAILDFSKVQGDRIDLSTIDANAALGGDQAFAFIGSAAFSAAGQVRAQVIGGNTFVFANTDATTATTEFSVVLMGSVALAGTDFIL